VSKSAAVVGIGDVAGDGRDLGAFAQFPRYGIKVADVAGVDDE
jgi:hypothetical protein